MSEVIYGFEKSQEYSNKVSLLPLWKEVYDGAFPGIERMEITPNGSVANRSGIDRILHMGDGTTITIDEKARKKNEKTGKVYDDIALEFISDEENDKPGWVVKPLKCDYIAYAILPLGICYVLPVIPLQQAWLKHGGDWRDNYFVFSVVSKDGRRTWRSLNCAVPAKVVLRAVAGHYALTFTPPAEIHDANGEA